MKKIIRLTESDLTLIVRRVISERKLDDSELEQIMVDLANSERFYLSYKKPKHTKNTERVCYTNLSDKSFNDDFTKYYDDIINFFEEQETDHMSIHDEYNNKKYEFELISDDDGNFELKSTLLRKDNEKNY